MRVLIAEDEPTSRLLLQTTLARLGYDVVVTEDGEQACEALVADDGPKLAVLDWMMPKMDGLEVCRHVRQRSGSGYCYILLLTAKTQRDDVVAGLEAGADDYVTKPFDRQELRSRLAVGVRIVKLQAALEDKIGELQEALTHVKQLQGLLPICVHCKKIRDDGDTWHRLETYIERHSEANFTHSLCSSCKSEHYDEQMKRIAAKSAGKG